MQYVSIRQQQQRDIRLESLQKDNIGITDNKTRQLSKIATFALGDINAELYVRPIRNEGLK